MTHRVFDAFHLALLLYFKVSLRPVPSVTVSSWFFALYDERERVAVTVYFLRQSPFAVEIQA